MIKPTGSNRYTDSNFKNQAFLYLFCESCCRYTHALADFLVFSENLLLQEDLMQIWPEMCEANAISAQLNKKVKFEIALISPQARGLTEGRTEVNVKMKDMKSGNEFMFSRADFLDRKFLMQEMYQNFQDGERDWDRKGVSHRVRLSGSHYVPF